jgi:hypothetical protein
MTAFDYSGPLATADRLIEKFGQNGFHRIPSQATGPKHNPTPGEPIDFPVRFAMVRYTAREIDGSRILATDRKALLSPVGLVEQPALSHGLVEANGVTWKIVGVETLRPAETTVLITLQVRK